ncbi:MAG: hypothetical protein DHS20C18_18680 [Saprospiraceae bacterium]|nr:MAG: hypothetical protein DHS20C18_18680 [Saprospiraceae bacterium]
MKKILLYLSFFPCLLFGQPSLFLTDPIPVSEAGTGYRAPRIALLEGNRPVVYWGKTGSNPVLYLAIWEGGNFGAPIAINTNGIPLDLWGGGLGPQIVAQGSIIYVVFESYGEGIYCMKSADGGQTFEDPVSVYDAPQGRVATLPSVAISPSGNPIVSFITTDFSEQNAQYEMTRSLDGGITFEPTTVANTAAAGAEVCECCPASIGIVTEDEMYLGFRNNDENIRDIWVAKTTDGGANFSQATDVDDTDWLTQVCPQSGPDMLVSGDSIFLVLFSGAEGSNVYFSSLNKETMAAGNQFQIPPFNGGNQNQNFPAIAGNGDTLGIIWQEAVTGSWDIMMAWSANGSGDLLNNYMVIDDDLLSQKQVDMAYQEGQFHIVYEDQKTSRVNYRIASFEEIVGTLEAGHSELLANVSPNPFSEKTVVSFENEGFEITTCTLFNTNGQQMEIFQTSGNTLEIEGSDLGKGVYFLKIQKGEYLVVKRLVVE